MAAQKQIKIAEIFCFFELVFIQNKIKALNSLDSSRPNGRLLENPKTGGSREHFCLKMISKLAPQ